MRIMDLTENNKWELDPNLNSNLENRMSVDPENTPAPKTTPNIKQMIPWDSYTYSIPLDIWYDYYRFVLQMGAENNMNSYNPSKQSPLISFYTKSERDRFLKLCKEQGIKYVEMKGEDVEEKSTQTNSCVPSSSFRDIF